MTVSTLTLRRAAALREMASLGLTLTQAAVLLQVEPASISYLKTRFGIAMRKGSTRPIRYNPIKDWIIRDFGKPGINATIMSQRYGSSANSINVTIHRLRKAGMLPPCVVKSAINSEGDTHRRSGP